MHRYVRCSDEAPIRHFFTNHAVYFLLCRVITSDLIEDTLRSPCDRMERIYGKQRLTG